ncbi:MAG: methyltransferase domain-containing protein [Chloracidobacterium sp.]|nr:methyltransferase domain-containing protein [Chloracidobacterium sp.]
MANEDHGWFARARTQRARRALERQLEYQKKKASGGTESDTFARNVFLHTQAVMQKIADVRPISPGDKVLEVGSGAHGLVFGLAGNLAVGIDPLAVEYKSLFPNLQRNAVTAAAIGEMLPFGDETFDVVMSDNVIDHAEDPLAIVRELVRVLKAGGILYFTVNVHHPVYELVSRLHGMWNGLGIKIEISPFADHTVHLTEERIRSAFASLPLSPVSQSSTVEEMKKARRNNGSRGAEAVFKKLFFKNAVYELVAVRK